MVEIFIGVALIGILALLIAVIFYSHFKLFSKQSTVIDVSSQNKIALEELTNQVRDSISITYPPNNPPPVGVFFDAASSAVSSGNVGSLSWQHTTTGSNRMLIVGVAFNTPFFEYISNVTYGGQSLDKIGVKNNGTNERIELWGLTSPNTGTNNVVVNLAFNTTRMVGGAISFTGVHQQTPLGTFKAGSDISGNPTVSGITSASDEIVVDIVGFDSEATVTPDASQTERWNKLSNGILDDIRGAMSTKQGAASVTMSWTPGSLPQQWAIGAVPIKPAPQSYPSASPSASCGGYISGTQTLVLWLWPIDASGEPFDPGTNIYDCIVYRRDSAKNTLIKKIVPGADSTRTASERIIASGVTNLQFSYSPNVDYAEEVTTTITTTGTVENQDVTQTQSAKVVLRNR